MTGNTEYRRLRAGMVGMGMIFDETYRPFFENSHRDGLFSRALGPFELELAAVASLTGRRAEAYRQVSEGRITPFESFVEPDSVGQLLKTDVDFVCVASPDNRHFDAARLPRLLALQALGEG